MQTFSKNKLALAIGSALMVMAGAAQAAAPAAPTLRASKPVLVAPASQANADDLYSATGLTGVLPVTVNLTAPADTTTPAIAFAVLSGGADGIKVNAANDSAATTGASAATDDIAVYAGTLGASQINLRIPTASVNFSANANTVNTASVSFIMVASGNEAFRVVSTTGALEYTADKTAASPTWLPVSMAVQQPSATNAILATDSTGAPNTTPIAVVAGQPLFNTVAPTIKISTSSTPTSATNPALISGLVVDTITPVTLLATATNINVSTYDPACAAINHTQALTVGDAPATIGTAVAPTATAAGSAKNTIAITAPTGTTITDGVATGTATASPDWTSGAVAADGAAYSSTCFHTGVSGTSVPVTVSPILTAEPQYTFVFNADGTNKKATAASGVWPAQAAYTDGATPVVVSQGISFTTTDSTDEGYKSSDSSLSIRFSEPMSLIVDDENYDDVRELLENIVVGNSSSTQTLASLSLNSGAIFPVISNISATANQETVTIDNLVSTSIADYAAGSWTGKELTVKPGITVQESNDTNYAANLLTGNILDIVPGIGANGQQLAGGLRSSSGAIEAIPSSTQTAIAPKLAIAWGLDTSAKAAASTAGKSNEINTITVTFDAGKEVKFNTGKTNSDLAKNLVIDVFGHDGEDPGIRFQVRPVSAELNAAGNQITITLPTAFIYNQLTGSGNSLNSVWVSYVVDNTDNTDGVKADSANNTLVAKNGTETIFVAQGLEGRFYGWLDGDKTVTGAEPVVLPLVFTAEYTGGQSTLLTQSIQTEVKGGASGDLVTAYLAYWLDQPDTTGDTAVAVTGGVITKGNDKIQTGLAIELADQENLELAIDAELDKVAPATKAIAGVQLANSAVKAADIPVYVKLVRSNDDIQNNDPYTNDGFGASKSTQNYINARAILATNMAEFAADGTNDNLSPVYACTLDPVKGTIKGAVTGTLTINRTVATGARGLNFLNIHGVTTTNPNQAIIGESVLAETSATGAALPGAANLNLLMGIDPASTDFAALTSKKPFVLLVHRDNKEGKYTLLTSADNNAANHMLFAPDVLNTKTDKVGAVARAASALSLNDIKTLILPTSGNWALYGLGNPATDVKALGTEKSLPKMLVGLNNGGVPTSFWTADHHGDMAMMIAANKVGVATELDTDIDVDGDSTGTGQTLSSMSANNTVAGAVGLAWSNGGVAAHDKIYVAQATGVYGPTSNPVTAKLSAGWSLVTVPSDNYAFTNVDAIIKVGAQVGMDTETLAGSGAGNGQFSWFAEDGTLPTGLLKKGDAVFVHATKAGNL